jgi:hypothetical protein
MKTSGGSRELVDSMTIDKRVLQSLPKVVLHEHLDNGSTAEPIRGVCRNTSRDLRTPLL